MSAGAKLTEENIRGMWPLHWLVWTDNHKGLKRRLEDTENEVRMR